MRTENGGKTTPRLLALSNLQYRTGALHTYVILWEYFGKKRRWLGWTGVSWEAFAFCDQLSPECYSVKILYIRIN
jgi:hypothetical protein